MDDRTDYVKENNYEKNRVEDDEEEEIKEKKVHNVDVKGDYNIVVKV